MTTTVLIIVNVFAALAIIVLALMQQSKGDMGSAFGGGGSQSMFGSRGSANFLSRMTATMCAVFFISSLALAYTYAQRAESDSVVGGESVIEQAGELPAASSEVPLIEGAEELPTTDTSGAQSEVPVIGDAVPAIEEAASEAVDSVEQAVDQAELPEVPQQ